MPMTLKSYRDEAKEFMRKIDTLGEGVKPKVKWLKEEFNLLEEAVDKEDLSKVRHQVYDMLFLLFEISADYDFDLDSEWCVGKERKRKKYVDNK